MPDATHERVRGVHCEVHLHIIGIQKCARDMCRRYAELCDRLRHPSRFAGEVVLVVRDTERAAQLSALHTRNFM